MIRVCQFCEKWSSGGIESFLFNVLTHADLSGLEVDIVAARLEESVFTEPLKALGVRFVELSGNQRDLPENEQRFRRLLRERNYDVIHLNIFQGLALRYGLLAAEEGVPVRIAHSHNTALRKSPTRGLKLLLHRWGGKQYARYATELWACSAEAARFMFPQEDLDQRGYRFIPNGIDTKRFQFDPTVRARMREKLGVGDRLVIGNVGRLCEQKNQDFLLDVFVQVRQMRSDTLLLLVGEGEARPLLEEKAARLGISDSVIFYGLADQVEELMWAMDVFAFPSLFEGLAFVSVEAQTAGLPVLFADCIPAEARITSLAGVLPLEAGAEQWARQLLAMTGEDRPAGAEEVRAAGFDVAQTARLVTDRYRGVK